MIRMMKMMRMAKNLTMMIMVMMNLEVEEGFYEVAAFPKDCVIKPVMLPNSSVTGIAWPGTYNIIITFNQITMNTTCTRHQASLSLYPPLSPVSDQELLPPCLFLFWALFFFLGNYFPLFITAHLFTSSALSRILRYCHNVRTRFSHVWRNGAFFSSAPPEYNRVGSPTYPA